MVKLKVRIEMPFQATIFVKQCIDLHHIEVYTGREFQSAVDIW